MFINIQNKLHFFKSKATTITDEVVLKIYYKYYNICLIFSINVIYLIEKLSFERIVRY